MIRDELAGYYGDDLLFLDEEYFDRAIVGVVHQCNNTLVCYSQPMVIQLLMEHSEMDEEEALDYFYFNVVGGYVGEKTPVFLEIFSFEEFFK